LESTLTIFEDIENWRRLLGPFPKQIPIKLEVTIETYNGIRAIAEHKTVEPIWMQPAIPGFDLVRVIIKDDLEVPWIIYDQHGEEMKRAEL
jgi:hypothetical protein